MQVRRTCLALCLIAWAFPATAGITVGEAPPGYLGKDGKGDKIQVSDFRGRLVIVSFFASWCGPCRKELPILANIQKAAGRDKVVVVAVNFKEEPDVVSRLRKAFKDFDVTITQDRNGEIGAKYGVKGIPRLVLIGRDGKVVAQHIGYGEESLPKLVAEINRYWNATEAQ